jgi:hypothetical protein
MKHFQFSLMSVIGLVAYASACLWAATSQLGYLGSIMVRLAVPMLSVIATVLGVSSVAEKRAFWITFAATGWGCWLGLHEAFAALFLWYENMQFEFGPSGLDDSMSDVRALVCIAVAYLAASAARHLFRRNHGASSVSNDASSFSQSKSCS